MSSLKWLYTNWVFLTNWCLSFRQLPFSVLLYHLLYKPFGVNTLPCNKTMEGEKHGVSLMETFDGPNQEIMYIAFVHIPLATSRVSGKCGLSSSLSRKKKKLVWWTAGPVVLKFLKASESPGRSVKTKTAEFLVQLVWNGPKTAFLVSSQEMLMLLIQGQCFGDHSAYVCLLYFLTHNIWTIFLEDF